MLPVLLGEPVPVLDMVRVGEYVGVPVPLLLGVPLADPVPLGLPLGEHTGDVSGRTHVGSSATLAGTAAWFMLFRPVQPSWPARLTAHSVELNGPTDTPISLLPSATGVAVS